VWPAGSGSQPSRAGVLLAVFAVLLLLVIANCLRFAVATSGRLASGEACHPLTVKQPSSSARQVQFEQAVRTL
jgi:hypothetical protein